MPREYALLELDEGLSPARYQESPKRSHANPAIVRVLAPAVSLVRASTGMKILPAVMTTPRAAPREL